MSTDTYYTVSELIRSTWAAGGVAALKKNSLPRPPKGKVRSTLHMPPHVKKAAEYLQDLSKDDLSDLLANHLLSKAHPAEALTTSARPATDNVYTTAYEVVASLTDCRLIYMPPTRVRHRRTSCFIVPSFINRPYILDFMPGRSLVAYLNAAGIGCYIAEPICFAALSHEKGQNPPENINAYVLRSLVAAFDAARIHSKTKKLHVLSHCMGVFAASELSRYRSSDIHKLALLAPPLRPLSLFPMLRREALFTGLFPQGHYYTLPDTCIPPEALRTFFSLMLWPEVLRRHERLVTDTLLGHEKNCAVGHKLELWLNSGIALPVGIIRDLTTTYADSIPRFMKHAEHIRIYAGRKDKVVRYRAAAPPRSMGSIRTFPGGHAGMLMDPTAAPIHRDIVSFFLKKT